MLQSMSKRTAKRHKKGVNISADLHRRITKNKDVTGIPIERFVEDAIEAALAR